MAQKQKWEFLDSDALKVVAIVTMFIDHIGAALLETAIVQGRASYDLYEVDMILRSVGRTAFPIFVFLLVEGFFHTRDRGRYLGRLILFTLISEVPFDLAFFGAPIYNGYQNVFWTLAIGFLVMWGMEKIREIRENRAGAGQMARGRSFALSVLEASCDALVLLAGCLAAYALHTDYGGGYGIGILLIALLYFGKRWNTPRILVCVAGYLLFLWEPWCIGGFVLILLYNGARRKRGKGFQYFFYLFYPVHLLIFGLARVAFFLN